MSRVFVGIGSNQQERLSNISEAIKRLGKLPSTRLVQMAPVYETEPVGEINQPDFLNTVVEIETFLSPHELISYLKKIESDFGRIHSERKWGPRVIDLDLLLYDEVVIKEERLKIPHPQIEFRRFVLEPLAQLDPDLKHPESKLSIRELLDKLPKEEQRVSKINA